MSTQEFAEKLDDEYERQRNKLMEQEKLVQLNTLEDRHECICLFVYRTNTVRELIAEIERVFPYKDGKGDIMLSTVHKAKGLEADNVYVLATERMPHPRAINMREEMNICYVAITRAKKNLYYVALGQPKELCKMARHTTVTHRRNRKKFRGKNCYALSAIDECFDKKEEW